jgi:hypothetical protein
MSSARDLSSLEEHATSAEQRRCQLQLLAAIVEYAERYENGEHFSPLGDDHGLTATQIAIVCSQLLKAADIAPFELAMWDSWHS